MSAVTYNPGEPVFDQSTGEPFITEDGDLVEVSPGLTLTASDGRTIDGDDVSNAAYYRGNLFLGESPRDASIGVPYLQAALGSSDPALAASVVVAEVRERTPGISGIVAVKVQGIDADRVLRWTGIVVKSDGSEQPIDQLVGGG